VWKSGSFLQPCVRGHVLEKIFAVAQAKVTHILRPGKASEKTPKGVIPPSLCEISQNASRKKRVERKLLCSKIYLETGRQSNREIAIQLFLLWE
jgi:hypothetical protein